VEVRALRKKELPIYAPENTPDFTTGSTKNWDVGWQTIVNLPCFNFR
jgi:hypothetical protein